MSKLYTLRYRKGNIGASSSFIQLNMTTGDPAKDFRLAEAIGQAYCNREINYRYITVQEAIVADESLLTPKEIDRIVNPPAKVRKPAPPNVDNPPAPGRLREEDTQPPQPTDPVVEDDDAPIGDEDEVMNRATPKGKSKPPVPEPDEDAQEQEVDEVVEETTDEEEEEVKVPASKGKGKKTAKR